MATKTKVKEEKKPLISADIPLAVPDERVPEGVIKVRLNEEAIAIYQRILGSLRTERMIPFDIDKIGSADILPLYYITQGKMSDRKAKDLAKYEYQKWENQTINDSYTIALTQETELKGQVVPYPEVKLNEGLTKWEIEAGLVEPPTMSHDLTNIYEIRLKILSDVMEDQGLVWQVEFNNVFNEAVAIFLQEASEEKTDPEGFQPEGASE